jgi:hypothetical protein
VDQLGARLLPGFEPRRLQGLLPRWGLDQLAATLGLKGGLQPCADAEVAELGWEVVATCAARALGLVDLAGNRMPAVRARRALISLASAHTDGLPEVARILDVWPATLRRARGRADDEAVLAVRRAISLALRVGRQG